MDKSRIFVKNILVDILAVTVAVTTFCLAVYNEQRDWFGVGAGFLAIFALASLMGDYFNPPNTMDRIKAPNLFARISAGVIGLLSGIYWVLSSWPGLLSVS